MKACARNTFGNCYAGCRVSLSGMGTCDVFLLPSLFFRCFSLSWVASAEHSQIFGNCCLLVEYSLLIPWNFYIYVVLLNRCFEAEKKREERERHPINLREVHPLEDVSTQICGFSI